VSAVECLPLDLRNPQALARLNAWLAGRTAEQRVSWALSHTDGPHALSSSFGAQAAVSLHLVSQQQAGIPVILIDTGYLFPETYGFVDQLTERLSLNLKVYRPAISASWAETRFGRLWEQGSEGLDRYNELHKVEPMRRALDELNVQGWFAGLRRDQSQSRRDIEFVQWQHGRLKFHPIADWTDRDVGTYLKQHALPYHPLWDQGYVSIGDTHTTRRWEPGMDAEETRFFGLKRECGLHSLV
jgi:phosphoadenosine phosphosulfate reductase